jgi:hypothetical protein
MLLLSEAWLPGLNLTGRLTGCEVSFIMRALGSDGDGLDDFRIIPAQSEDIGRYIDLWKVSPRGSCRAESTVALRRLPCFLGFTPVD